MAAIKLFRGQDNSKVLLRHMTVGGASHHMALGGPWVTPHQAPNRSPVRSFLRFMTRKFVNFPLDHRGSLDENFKPTCIRRDYFRTTAAYSEHFLRGAFTASTIGDKCRWSIAHFEPLYVNQISTCECATMTETSTKRITKIKIKMEHQQTRIAGIQY
jgi:hypothetical protein